MTKTKMGDTLHCHRCDGEWQQGGNKRPKTCRWCNTPNWDKPRSKAATVQRIPKVIENSNPEDYFQGVRVFFHNGMYIGRYGTILGSKKPDPERSYATVIVDFYGIIQEYPLENMKIIQAVD